MSLDINILNRFKVAREMDRAEHLAGEQAKLGILRAGSSGILTEQGDVAGSCLRKSHLRTLGIELEDITEDKFIMFELGYANEDIVYNHLNKSKAESEVILREEEIPIEWTTSNGVKVTGRPDMVICTERDGQKTPVLGLELKSVHSVWTARDVFFGRKPKLSNMIQAAHYMWKLNVPYKMIYKSYSILGQGAADWMHKFFPKMGELLDNYMTYSKVGKMMGVKQFEIVYDLRLDEHGRVHYREEGDEKWIASIVTTGDIQRYFEHASQLGKGGSLGPRPVAVDTLGKKANYSDCDYCPLNAICDNVEKKKLGYDEWKNNVIEFKNSPKVTKK